MDGLRLSITDLLSVVDDQGPMTAEELAADLDVSVEEIEHAIAELRDGGVPIEESAAAGYSCGVFTLPALSLTIPELEALASGLAMVVADDPYAEAAERLAVAIAAALPEGLREVVFEWPGVEPWDEDFDLSPEFEQTLDQLGWATTDHRKVWLKYRAPDGSVTERVVWPLELLWWGRTWTLAAWCELRQDYRDFAPESIERFEVLDAGFSTDGEVSAEGYRARSGGR
jgi:predicted DNA-binding transcriptional regulator YafY